MINSFLLYRIIIQIIFCFLLLGPVNSQITKENLEEMIENARMDWNVPGMAVGIYYDGKVFSSKGYGVVEASGSKKIDEHTLFAIASNTKAFVAAAIAMLVEEGKIAWHDPVQRYIPEFALADPCVSEMVTIEDLLCHRVGLGTYSGDVLWYKSGYQPQDLIPKLKHLPLLYPFRDGSLPSNLHMVYLYYSNALR